MSSDLSPEHLRVKDLGPRERPSPLCHDGSSDWFVTDGSGVPVDVEVIAGRERRGDLLFEKAGPREHVFFDPKTVRAAIATCGGLCPGLNNVIRSIVFQLHHGYGVRSDVIGIPYGYLGMHPASGLLPMTLSLDRVAEIHKHGGSILGTSRKRVEPEVAVSFLQRLGVQILFAIGGDGTLRGAHLIHREAERRGYPLAVVGVPKTIDNDIPFVWRSFGYFTALERAREVIVMAHNEASGHLNGVGLVRLMGRNAGFIAAGATLASQEVNVTLIPEVPFRLDGPKGLLAHLRERLHRRRHAVIAVAEGAGQDLIDDDPRYQTVGTSGLKNIGLFLLDRIKRDAEASGVPANVKYFDPNYQIRSSVANSEDSLFSDQLARHAVHAAMAGKTDTVIGLWYNVVTHVPIELVVDRHKRITESNEIWRAVLQATGQPARFE